MILYGINIKPKLSYLDVMICDPAGCVLYEHFHASLSSFVLNLCHVQNVFHAGYYEYRPNLLYFIYT